jgi:hypothetical protein
VEARDWPDRRTVPPAPVSATLRLDRAFPRWQGLPPLALVAFPLANGFGLAVVLARGVLVGWPFDEGPQGVPGLGDAGSLVEYRQLR